MSYNNQLSHEVRSIKLQTLVKGADKLAHLTNIGVAMTSYTLYQGWFGSVSIIQRWKDLEPCGMFDTLGVHLKVPLSTIEEKDMIAVAASDAEAIAHALQKK